MLVANVLALEFLLNMVL